MTRASCTEVAAAGVLERLDNSAINPMRCSLPQVQHWLAQYWGWCLAGIGTAAASLAAAPGASGILGAGLAIVMLAIAAVDSRHFIIPDTLVLTALAVGIADVVIARPGPLAETAADAVLRSAAIAVLFYVFRAAYRWLRGRDGMGLGDVKLSAVAGLWLGWTGVAIAIDIAALSAIAVVAIRALRGDRIGGTTRLPFGLFLAPAIWIAWMVEMLMPGAPF